MKFTSAVLATLIATSLAIALRAQVQERPIPRIVKKDGRFALFVDDAPYLMLGAQVHNSSTWPNMLPKVWPAMEYLNVNTVEMPIYWEQFEPRQGQYDYTTIDTVLEQARQHHLRLVLLWFGTWKNGSQHYMPEWMKLAPDRYPHMVDKNGQAVDSPSPFAAASLEADKTAFTAFMRHLKTADPERTAIMVQVENEAGTWGALRDYSSTAQKLFEAPVPPEVLTAMQLKITSPSLNWQEAFGPEAEVCFHAWSVAKYVGQVAAAGKAVYPLPLYANAALRDPLKPGAPGTYESGGPTDNVLAIWKVAAPALDILAPDIYQNDPAAYLRVLQLYRRDDNPLFVPETGGAANARFFFSALGLQTIGFSPFGMDYSRGHETTPGSRQPDEFAAWAMNYRLIGPMQREIAELNFEGKLKAVAEVAPEVTESLPFGDWNAEVSYGATRNGQAIGNAEPTGRALVARLSDNQFLVAGFFCRVDFRPAGTDQQRKSQHIVEGSGQIPSALIDGKWQHRQFLRVEEGIYENGVFNFVRIWNGDETDWGLNFGSEPVVLRVSVATY
ncbi:MAG: DUF5597 domain-containing protein [Candidatus Sulfotelmatobacter sp.]